MSARLTLKTQLALSLLVALGMGYLLQMGEAAGMTTAPPTPQPFTTLAGAWAVEVSLQRSAAPQIDSLSFLESGRLTVTQPGDSSLQLLDGSGRVLFEQSFQPVFVQGEPLLAVDTIRRFFVLPAPEGARSLRVITPQGEAAYELPGE